MKIHQCLKNIWISFSEKPDPEFDTFFLDELKADLSISGGVTSFILPFTDSNLDIVFFLQDEYKAVTDEYTADKLKELKRKREIQESMKTYSPVYPLKQYQKEAVEKILIRPAYALFHDPGLGKTKTVLDMFALRRREEPNLKLFIVCPNFLVLNWREEIKKHTPQFSFVALHGGTKNKMEAIQMKGDIYVTNIEGLAPRTMSKEYEGRDGSTKVKKVKKEDFQTALLSFLSGYEVIGVVDESTAIKNPTAKTTKFLLSIKEKFKYRYILTGTPVPNSLLDIWSQLTFLDSMATGYDKFYNFKNFHFEFKGDWNQILVRVKFENLLYERISNWADIKKKEHCYDLPEKIYKVTYIDMPPELRKEYDRLKATCKTEFQTMEKESVKIEKNHVLSKAQTMMQLCKGFFFTQELTDDLRLEPKINWINCNKYQVLSDMLETEYSNSKCIIWTTHIPEREFLTGFLTGSKFKFECLFPEMKAEEISDRIKKFQDGKINILVCSLQSFNKGITLTSADVEIFFSNTYNWEMRAQAEDRTHRIGTVKSPIYHDIITTDSIEELIFRNLHKKGSFAEEFVKEILER
jgi:SNF2 family DNA or RNA helicase